jgi:glycosyltransferase involved in cell wall biosynthesis
MGVLVLPIAEAMDIPIVSSFYGADISVLPRKKHIRKKYQQLFRSETLFHAISNHVKDRLKELGASSGRTRVVHLGTRLEKFVSQNISQDEEVNKKKGAGMQARHPVRCLHVGRLVEKKAPVYLVRAFQHAREMGAPIHLKIAGDGPLLSDVEEEIEQFGLEENIELLGSVPHSHVPELMARSHIYTQHCVTASNGDQEGMGVTFAEASAAGLPIVTTSHNGIPDVVKHESTGYLVEEGDIEAMGRRIAQLASSPEKRHQMGQAGREHVHANFQLSKQADKMTSCYHEAIDLKN